MENLRITLIQDRLVWENPEENRSRFSEIIASIKEETDLILLPEMFTTGFSMNPEPFAGKPEGPTLKWMQGQAENKNAAICGSYMVKEDDQYFNRLYFVFPDGTFKTYDKRHLFTHAGEHKQYTPGNKKLILDYKNWKIAPLICYDLRFPVWARNTENYDFLLYIANWPQSRIQQWETMLGARSIENQCYVAGLNRVGSDPNGIDYNGHSVVFKPMGEKMSFPSEEESGVHTFVLEKEFLHKIRRQFRFLEDRDTFKIG